MASSEGRFLSRHERRHHVRNWQGLRSDGAARDSRGAARLKPGTRDLGREVLGATDGRAAFALAASCRAAATDANVFMASAVRRELIAALNNGVYPPPSNTPSSTPKIIYVVDTIDANVDDDDRLLSCNDYNRNGYTVEAYCRRYDPAVWGMVLPSGPLEQARIASQQAQQARVRIRVGSNTTIVGIFQEGDDPRRMGSTFGESPA